MWKAGLLWVQGRLWGPPRPFPIGEGAAGAELPPAFQRKAPGRAHRAWLVAARYYNDIADGGKAGWV